MLWARNLFNPERVKRGNYQEMAQAESNCNSKETCGNKRK